MLRDWTDSDKVNSLSVHSERFFVRLIMKVDDYGCFHADTRLLKAHLFPMLLDSIREADLLRWMAECQKAGLIVLYEVATKKYVRILDFKQRLDKANSKYPLPPVNDFPEPVNDFPAELEEEVEKNKKLESAAAQIYTQDQKTSFINFQKFIKDHSPNVGKLKEQFTIDQFFKLKETFTTEQIMKLLVKMHNYKPLLKNNVSAYLTFLNWSRNNFDKEAKVVPLSGPSPAELQAQQILKEVNSK
jgi:hypothetical protein